MDNFSLINPTFTFSLGGKDFQVRKANLEKGILYQAKVKELMDSKDPQTDLKLVAYCAYIVLKDADPTLTEVWVNENLPADIDPLEVLGVLGFISQKKMEAAKKIQDFLASPAAIPTPKSEDTTA